MSDRVELGKQVASQVLNIEPIDPPAGAGGEWWQLQIEQAVESCDMGRADTVLVSAAIYGLAEFQIQQWFTSAVQSATHDVQVFWKGECNCDGHLN